MTKHELMGSAVKLGLMAAVVALGLPDAAFAQDLTTSISEVKSGMGEMPTILSGIAYLGGGATMLHGAGLLKKHADQPTGTTLAQGLSRLVIGALIAALPILMQFVATSISTGDDKMTFNKMSEIK